MCLKVIILIFQSFTRNSFRGIFLYAQHHSKEDGDQYFSTYVTDTLGHNHFSVVKSETYKESYSSGKGLNKGGCGAPISSVFKNLLSVISLQWYRDISLILLVSSEDSKEFCSSSSPGFAPVLDSVHLTSQDSHQCIDWEQQQSTRRASFIQMKRTKVDVL